MPKNKPNAFLYFMLEWQKKEMKKGRKFPNGLKDVQSDPECNALWKASFLIHGLVIEKLEKKRKN